MKRAYYSKSVRDFLVDDPAFILGELTRYHSFALEDLQKNAWMRQIQILKETLSDSSRGYIFFEFSIPRMGKRVDNILIIDDLVFVIEFKVGDGTYHEYAKDQVVDYCLDLINFHEASHHAKIIPILVATDSALIENKVELSKDYLYTTQLTNADGLKEVLSSYLSQAETPFIDPEKWENSVYKPTPTIVEAAQALYKGHDVGEISRSDAGKINLSKTADAINKIIEDSKTNNKKSICFITGVPGAGKTLAGLNIANERQRVVEEEHAVFLSGNGPLVDVMREALVRDQVAQSKLVGQKLKKSDVKRRVNSFIQNIHHFRDEYLNSEVTPTEKVVVFDEAQRAWTKEQASKFMKRKRGKEDFDISEPEFLVGVMDRHKDWCVVICLIGGGQEINIGEAGLEEWIKAIKSSYGHWNIHFSEAVVMNQDYVRNSETKSWLEKNGFKNQNLHLAVSARSFRSEKVSDFVHATLELQLEEAQDLFTEVSPVYPVVITRDFERAKNWLRLKSLGTERIGVVASAGERRLRAVGVHVKNEIDPSNWFLNDKNDVRSSFFLEDVATEFDIQGLEIDWVCIVWGANLYFDGEQWVYQAFKGSKWTRVKNDLIRRYLKNSYRVLLTRARQGMVIYIPRGSDTDQTRPHHFYDRTFELLKNIGLQEI